MKVTITLNKQTFHRDIPVSWDQVTFGDFLKLDSCGQDIIKVIALLTRMDYEQLKKAHVKNLDGVVAILGFLKKPMTLPSYQSVKVLHGYPLPKNLEFEEVQMYLDLQNYMQEVNQLTDLEKLGKYTTYCAVYACKHRYGKYDWKLAEELAPVFLDAPCTEVMAVGNFTLMRLIGLNLNINLNSLKAGSPIKRFRLAIKSWVMLSGHFFRSLVSRKRLV